jgi:hypothetical protein
MTVQYKVGVPRIEALVRLYDTVNANADWLPAGLGVAQPIVKPKGIDDVPIVTLTLFSTGGASGRRARVQGTVVGGNPNGHCEQEAAEATGHQAAQRLEIDATGVELL